MNPPEKTQDLDDGVLGRAALHYEPMALRQELITKLAPWRRNVCEVWAARPRLSKNARTTATMLRHVFSTRWDVTNVTRYTSLIAIAISTGCGGSVTESTSNPGGGNGRGGSAAVGGQGSGGSRVGDGGTSSTQGILPEACTQPQVSGPCDAFIPSYWHDPEIGICRPFIYGGCEGNENRFESLSECQKTCQGVLGGGKEYDLCSAPSDCALTASSCCGSCDPVELNAYISVRRDVETAFRANSGCAGIMCEPCLEVAPTQRTSRFFYATCESGQCAVRDLRATTLTECKSASDCVLRCGTGCCESCSGSSVVALKSDVDTVAEFCGGLPVPCPNCACAITSGITADCRDGRCSVTGEAVCTVGMDQTCNDDPLMSSLAGICNKDGSCSCNPGRTYVTASGRCR